MLSSDLSVPEMCLWLARAEARASAIHDVFDVARVAVGDWRLSPRAPRRRRVRKKAAGESPLFVVNVEAFCRGVKPYTERGRNRM